MSGFARALAALRGGEGSAPPLLPDPHWASPMPWVIAIVTTLTVIAAASGLALSNAAARASADLSGGVTVQIVSAAAGERNREADAALAALRTTPRVAEAHRIAQSDLEALLEPWLGTRPGDTIDDLPIPALIDVRLTGAADPAAREALARAVHRVAPAARLDAEAAWLGPVFRAIATLQWLAGAMIALMGLALVVTVVLTARNALVTYRETIAIVHMLGGTDAQIARVFQRTAAMDAVLGGLIGLIAGTAGVVLLAGRFSALGSGLMTGAELTLADWAVIAAIPLAAIAIAVATARLTVLSALRRML